MTLTLPSTASVGSTIQIRGVGAGGWRIAQGAGQSIAFGNKTTTAGNTGRIDSTQARDCVDIECTTADTDWMVVSSVGNLDIV